MLGASKMNDLPEGFKVIELGTLPEVRGAVKLEDGTISLWRYNGSI